MSLWKGNNITLLMLCFYHSAVRRNPSLLFFTFMREICAASIILEHPQYWSSNIISLSHKLWSDKWVAQCGSTYACWVEWLRNQQVEYWAICYSARSSVRTARSSARTASSSARPLKPLAPPLEPLTRSGTHWKIVFLFRWIECCLNVIAHMDVSERNEIRIGWTHMIFSKKKQ